MTFYIIYKTTNLVNKKFYIGYHCTSNLDDGYLGSGKILKQSIRKYGKNNFQMIPLEFFESSELALKREMELVTEELLQDPMCMNLCVGGRGMGWRKSGQKTLKRIHFLQKNDEKWKKAFSDKVSLSMKSNPRIIEKCKLGAKITLEKLKDANGKMKPEYVREIANGSKKIIVLVDNQNQKLQFDSVIELQETLQIKTKRWQRIKNGKDTQFKIDYMRRFSKSRPLLSF